MKRFLIGCSSLIVFVSSALAQQGPPASPAETTTATIAGKTITIHYSSPGLKGGRERFSEGRIDQPRSALSGVAGGGEFGDCAAHGWGPEDRQRRGAGGGLHAVRRHFGSGPLGADCEQADEGVGAEVRRRAGSGQDADAHEQARDHGGEFAVGDYRPWGREGAIDIGVGRPQRIGAGDCALRGANDALSEAFSRGMQVNAGPFDSLLHCLLRPKTAQRKRMLRSG